MRISRIAPVLLLLALTHVAAACGSAQQPPASEVLVLEDVTVIDGTGAAPRAGMTLVVEGGRITALFPAGSQRLPAGARRLDAAGGFVIPGLIDSHVHLASAERPPEMTRGLLRNALLGGVTTVRDMGGDPRRVAALAAAARDESTALPRIHYSAVVAGPDWFASYDPRRLAYWSGGRAVGTAPGVRRMTDTTDLAALVREAAALGATSIKVYADVPAPRLAALSAAAHGAGLRVWAHAVVPPARPEEVSAAGVDVVSHADQLIWTAAPPGAVAADREVRRGLLRTVAPDGPAVTALLEGMRARGTLLEPTLLVMQMAAEPGAPLDTLPAWAVAVTRRAHALGVGIVAGTDALGRETPNLHSEMQLLVGKAGLPPLEALRAGTQRGAEALGIADSVGSVAVGMRADLVVLRADPSADIRNTQTIRYVIRGGTVHARTEPWETPQGASPPPE
jgi:imidazolonepropionase-like amidohydrolase